MQNSNGKLKHILLWVSYIYLGVAHGRFLYYLPIIEHQSYISMLCINSSTTHTLPSLLSDISWNFSHFYPRFVIFYISKAWSNRIIYPKAKWPDKKCSGFQTTVCMYHRLHHHHHCNIALISNVSLINIYSLFHKIGPINKIYHVLHIVYLFVTPTKHVTLQCLCL